MLDILKFSEIIIAILLIFVVLIQNKNVSLNLSDMSSWMGEIFVINSIALFLLK